jgi:hypothetical protein
MRHFRTLISLLVLLTLQSCKSSSTDFASEWTTDIKQKIIEDANQIPTKTVIDSTRNEITIFRDNKKLKYFYFKPKVDSFGKHVFTDTGVSVFYSKDQKFELVRELCPASDRSFEGIKYKGVFIGLSEFKYCDGRIKERGFRYYGDIGTWLEFDSTGKVIKETKRGNEDQLKELKKIKYYR